MNVEPRVVAARGCTLRDRRLGPAAQWKCRIARQFFARD
jgi:hypothetical protein